MGLSIVRAVISYYCSTWGICKHNPSTVLGSWEYGTNPLLNPCRECYILINGVDSQSNGHYDLDSGPDYVAYGLQVVNLYLIYRCMSGCVDVHVHMDVYIGCEEQIIC